MTEVLKTRVLELRNGQLGSLPIIIGLVSIAIVFQSLHPNYLTPINFVNLLVQGAAMAAIAMGMVFVLLIGEIDLSAGFVSGVAAVSMALLLVPDGANWPVWVVLPIAIGIGAVIGGVHGLLITKLRLPSFVVTLAGLLAWNGVVLLLIGGRGSVIIQDRTVVSLTSSFLPSWLAWILLVLCVAAYAATLVVRRRNRVAGGLAVEPFPLDLARIALVAVFGTAAVVVTGLSLGVPYVTVVLGLIWLGWTYVLNRTRFGTWVYAIGGSVEAARRAGINTDRVRIVCFMICSSMAAVGGIILASRLRSVDTNVGGGSLLLYSIAAAVIGGTSLFGGHGSAKAAILGALVIAAIDNGLGLLGLGSGQKFVITGVVLLVAVAVDALSRQGRAAAGKS